MKLLKIGILTVFVIVSVAFTYVFVREKYALDDTKPTILCETELLEVSLKPDNAELLKGVTAYDEKDGDITDRVIVETISKFKTSGVSTVTYSVSDSDMHVTKFERDIKYKDYRKPRFTLDQALVYNTNTNMTITDVVGATDVIDGDISQDVVVTVDNMLSRSRGVHTVLLSVTNSKGDTSELKLPVFVETLTYSTPKPELTEYLIYVSKGAVIDPQSYIMPGQDSFEIKIDSDLDTSKPGVYKIEYHATDVIGGMSHSVLNVVVEG